MFRMTNKCLDSKTINNFVNVDCYGSIKIVDLTIIDDHINTITINDENSTPSNDNNFKV